MRGKGRYILTCIDISINPCLIVANSWNQEGYFVATTIVGQVNMISEGSHRYIYYNIEVMSLSLADSKDVIGKSNDARNNTKHAKT